MKLPDKRRRLHWIWIAPLLVIILVAVWGLMDSTGGASARTMWNDTWRDREGALLGGYLVTPVQARRVVPRPATGNPAPAIPSADGRYPAVLLLHEWWGLNKNMANLAEQLAADGYVVLAPDLLRGKMAVTLPGAVVQLLTTPQDRIDRDLDRALERLLDVPDVDPDRVAVVGFCFGGTQAMNLGMRSGRIGATAILYGGGPLGEGDDPGLLGSAGPVLGIYGGRDRTIPQHRVEEFEHLLRRSGVTTEFHVFADQGHAFITSSSIRERGDAAEAWDRLRRFLRQSL